MKSNFGSYGIDFARALVKEGLARKEYLVDGGWTSAPKGRVSGERYFFDFPAETMENVWSYMQENQKYESRLPGKVLVRLAKAASEGTINTFSPWGPRYSYRKRGAEIKPSDPEIGTLENMAKVLEDLKSLGIAPIPNIMLADTYGTEINGLPEEVVEEYYQSLAKVAPRIVKGCQVTKWSDIRSDSNYAEIERDVKENLCEKYVRWRTLKGAEKTARRFNPKDPEGAAEKYAIERVAEALVIEEMFEPLKLSLVRKEKDNLDNVRGLGLPVVYLIDEENRGPWL